MLFDIVLFTISQENEIVLSRDERDFVVVKEKEKNKGFSLSAPRIRVDRLLFD
jgi:hypothetical protein